jgi:hypothetical protein
MTTLRAQRAIATAGSAGVFLRAFASVTVLDQLFAIAGRTLMRYHRSYPEKALRINLPVALKCLFILHQSKCHHYRHAELHNLYDH